MVIVLNPISAEKVSSIWSSKQNTRGGGADINAHEKKRKKDCIYIPIMEIMFYLHRPQIQMQEWTARSATGL